ncbi:36211_t:CDS:2, partial [Gigaspora margarita]
YTGITHCGIPKVTLEGTLEDWMKLYEKVANLRKLNLELDFWIDRVFGSGGGTYISGWLMNFFSYSGDHRVKIEDIPNSVVAGFIGANQEILEGSDNESVVTS